MSTRRHSRRGLNGPPPLFTSTPLPRRPTPPPLNDEQLADLARAEAEQSYSQKKRKSYRAPKPAVITQQPQDLPHYAHAYLYPSDPPKGYLYSQPNAGPTCLVRGSILIDEVLHVPKIIHSGESFSSTSYSIRVAGKGATQACALAMAGARVELIGAVGADGTWVKEYIRRRGVGVEYLEQMMDRPSGRAVIQVTPTGEKATLIIPGTNPSNLHPAPLHLHPPVSHILLQNEIAPMTSLEWINEAASRNITVVYNPSPLLFDEELAVWPWNKIQYLILNQREAEQFVSSFSSICAEESMPPLGPTLPTDLKKAYHTLIHLSHHRPLSNTGIIMTLGSKGALALLPTAGSRDSKIFYEAATVLQGEVRETAGAGDTFTGYFVAGLMELAKLHRFEVQPNDWELLIWRAVIASGMAVERPGVTDAIPHRQEVEARLAFYRREAAKAGPSLIPPAIPTSSPHSVQPISIRSSSPSLSKGGRQLQTDVLASVAPLASSSDTTTPGNISTVSPGPLSTDSTH